MIGIRGVGPGRPGPSRPPAGAAPLPLEGGRVLPRRVARMDDHELVIRTGSSIKRFGRVLAPDGMSPDARPASLPSFSAPVRVLAPARPAAPPRRSTRSQASDLRPTATRARNLPLRGTPVTTPDMARHGLTGKRTSEAARASTARWPGDMPCRKGWAARVAAVTSIMAITAACRPSRLTLVSPPTGGLGRRSPPIGIKGCRRVAHPRHASRSAAGGLRTTSASPAPVTSTAITPVIADSL
jgi:hypothetical protein